VIENFLLQCLDEPFDVGVGVRGPIRRLFPFRPRRVEDRIKRLDFPKQSGHRFKDYRACS
jgi:hypothetical protein